MHCACLSQGNAFPPVSDCIGLLPNSRVVVVVVVIYRILWEGSEMHLGILSLKNVKYYWCRWKVEKMLWTPHQPHPVCGEGLVHMA